MGISVTQDCEAVALPISANGAPLLLQIGIEMRTQLTVDGAPLLLQIGIKMRTQLTVTHF
jgi:hypothetical protein